MGPERIVKKQAPGKEGPVKKRTNCGQGLPLSSGSFGQRIRILFAVYQLRGLREDEQ